MMNTRPWLAATCAVILGAFVCISGSTVLAQAEDGQTTIDTDQLTVGGTGGINLNAKGYTSCAGTEVRLALLFRPVTERGYGSFAEAVKIDPQTVKVDAGGDFSATLRDPATFPGWLGYVSMEGSCVTLAPQRLLARIRVAVPLGGSAARDAGLNARDGAVIVIPAAEVRAVPILPGESATSPYQKISPAVLRAGGRDCSEATEVIANSAGDVVLSAGGCAGQSPAVLSVGSPATETGDRTFARDGYAIPVRLVFTAARTTGTDTEPLLPPNAGAGPTDAAGLGTRSGRTLPWAVLLLFPVTSVVVVFVRRSRR